MNQQVLSCLCCIALGCGTNGGVGATCHRTADCDQGLGCVGPDDGPVCGIAPQHGCDTNADCTAPEVCHAIPDSCSASGVGSMCGAPCTATSCGGGFSCNASGSCEPTACTSTSCPAFQRCGAPVTSGPMWSHANGCATIACTTAQDCTTGLSCVNSFCQTSAGTCMKILAVP